MTKVEIQLPNGNKLIGEKTVPILYNPDLKIYTENGWMFNPALSSLFQDKIDEWIKDDNGELRNFLKNLHQKQVELLNFEFDLSIYHLVRPRITNIGALEKVDRPNAIKKVMDTVISELEDNLPNDIEFENENLKRSVLSHVIAKGHDYYKMVLKCPQIVEYLIQDELYVDFYEVFKKIDGLDVENLEDVEEIDRNIEEYESESSESE